MCYKDLTINNSPRDYGNGGGVKPENRQTIVRNVDGCGNYYIRHFPVFAVSGLILSLVTANPLSYDYTQFAACPAKQGKQNGRQAVQTGNTAYFNPENTNRRTFL